MIEAFLRFLFHCDSSLCRIDKEVTERHCMCNLSELRLPCCCFCSHPTFSLPVALCPSLTSSLPQVSRCFCSSTHVYSCFPAVSTTPNLTLSTWEKNQWSTLQKTDWRPSSRALGQAVFPNSSGLTLHAGSTPQSQMGLCLKNCRDGGVVWFCWIF